MKQNIYILVLFLVGFSLVLYPWLDRKIQENKQNQLLTEWQVNQSDAEKSLPMRSSPVAVSGIESLEADIDQLDPPILLDGYKMLGTISIPAIDANEPILDVTTKGSLKIGIGNVVENQMPGMSGNMVLAGHRSRTFGKQFNRLYELNIGDSIELDSSEGHYTYNVTEIFLVTPDDLSVLEQDEREHTLTLITCHPVKNPTHRLIIRASMKS